MDDTANRIPLFAGLLNNRHHDYLPGLRTTQGLTRDQKIMRNVLAVGHHEVNPPLLVQAPDNLVGFALENLNNAALPTAATINPADTDQSPIIMHQGPHFLRGKVKILTSLIGTHETEPIRMRNDAAGYQIGLIDDAVSVTAIPE
jgi:hypothetical protein